MQSRSREIVEHDKEQRAEPTKDPAPPSSRGEHVDDNRASPPGIPEGPLSAMESSGSDGTARSGGADATEPAALEGNNGRDGPARELSEGKAKEATPDEQAEAGASGSWNSRGGSWGTPPQQRHSLGITRPRTGGTGKDSPIQMLLRWPSRKANRPGPEGDQQRPATARDGPQSSDGRRSKGSIIQRPVQGDGESDADADTEPTGEEIKRHERQASIESLMLADRRPSKSRSGSRNAPAPLSNQSRNLQPSGLANAHKPETSISSADLRESMEGGSGKQGKGTRSTMLKVDNDTLIMDLVLASAAAPTFFPSHRSHVDGAIVSNNPALAAITTVLSPDTIGTPKIPAKVHVLSIGTGYKAQFLETNNDHDWGVLQWAPWLSEMMLYSAQLNATQLSATLLGENFHRLDLILEEAVAMDNPAVLPLLEEKAKECDLSAVIAWIKRHVYGEKEQEASAGSESEPRKLPKKRKKTKASAAAKNGKRASQRGKERKGEEGEDDAQDDEVPHNNMHWGTDAWFSTQRMWEG